MKAKNFMGEMRGRFGALGFLLTIILAFSGLLALDYVASPESASAVGNTACSKDMAVQNGYKATPSHGQVFYIDTGVSPKVDASYVGYSITNTTGSAQTFWVSLTNFIGGKVALANPSDQYQQITNLASGATSTVFYLLKATGASTSAQSHTVKVWDKRPDLSGATASLTCDFTFVKVAETIKANANKIGTVGKTFSPATATLGGLVSITLTSPGSTKTQTGTLGAGSAPDFAAFWASPAAYSTWPTQALRLESTSITITCQGSNANIVLTNRLFVSDTTAPSGGTTLTACISNGQGSEWTATYNFRIIGPAASAVTPCPIANISSGTQYKHSDVNGIASNTSIDLTAVSAANAMTVEVAAAKDTTTTTPAVPSSHVRIKYTVTVSTSSSSALQVDEIVDTHATLTSPAGYVASSTTKKLGNGSTTAGPEPNVLAAEASQTPPPQHFVGPFTGITSSASQYLYYSFDIPCDGNPHSTSVMAYVSDTGIALTATTQRSVTVTATSGNCANPTITQGTVTLDPTAETTPVTPSFPVVAGSLTASTATLNGILNASGNSGTSYRFIYSTDATLAYATASAPSWTNISGSPSSNTAYSQAVTGLNAMTTYYYQIQIRNSSGTIFSGGTLSFTTLAQQAKPAVNTVAASRVGSTVATLNGTLNPNLTQILTVKFDLCTNSAMTAGCAATPYTVYTTDDATGNQIALAIAANSSGDFIVNSDSNTGTQLVTGLTGSTTYYFRLYVTCNSDATYCPNGRVDGSVLAFTTGAPAATTLDATAVGGTSATLNGTVNANNTTNSAVSFCFSTSSTSTNGALNSCSVGTASTPSISGSADTAETSAITGLTNGTTYYFQVKVVTSTNVTAYGAILQFTTLGITTTSPITNGAVGSPYSGSFAGTGGSNTYTWATNSTLPVGMTLSPEGLLSGTPSTPGTFSINVTMTDPLSGLSVTKLFTFNIAGDPTVTSTDATSVKFTTATINGTVSPNGTTVTGASFCWGTDSSLNTCTSITIDRTGFGSLVANPVSANLTGLSANTNYYFKVTATWGASGTTSTSPRLFKTASVTTADPSSIGLNGATVGGLFIAGTSAFASADVTESKICYSKSNSTAGGVLNSGVTCTTNFWTGTSSVAASGNDNYSKALTGLDTLTQYYYQQQVTLAGNQLSYGSVKTFTTMDAPTATVDSALQVTGRSAKIRGKINPRGNSMNQVKFCWSTDSTISIASCNQADVGTSFITLNNSDNSIDTALSNLTPGTTYYYIIYAKTNNFLSGASIRFRAASVKSQWPAWAQVKSRVKTAATVTSDTVYSNTSSFTTAGAVTDAASNVGYNAATLNGTLTASSSGLQNTDVSSVKLCYSTSNTLVNGLLSVSPVCSTSLWGSTVLTGAQAAAFSTNVTGLTQGTVYYSQIQTVFYDNTVLNGNPVQFTTATLQVPSVTPADNISSTTATFHGAVDAKGTTLSSVQFCYDTTTAFTNCAANTLTVSAPAGGWTTGVNTISKAVTGLTSSTTYYFKVLTTSNLASVNSGYETFKTLSVLSFNAQNGSAVQSIEYTTGATVNLSTSTTTRTGYTFLGWFADPTTGTAVASNYVVPGTTDQVLYAHWSQDSYAVTFDEHGGSTVNDTTYIYGGQIQNPGTPTRSGYTFTGWFTAQTNGTQYTFPYTTTGTGPITIHAQWSIVTYNITFDERLGSAVSDATYTIGTTIEAPSPGTTRNGYRFDGWYDSATGGNLITFTAPNTYPTAGTTGDLTLYAHWTAYTVTFSAGTGTGTPPPSMSGSITLPAEADGSMTAPANSTFGGWQCPSGTATLAAGSTFNPTSNVTCTAVWVMAGSKTVTFHKNFGGSTDTSTQSTNTQTNLVANSFTVTGYTFIYWCKTAATTCDSANRVANQASYSFSANLDLYAIWQINSYDVTFVSNYTGGPADVIESKTYNTVIDLTTRTLTRTGYTIAGWSRTQTGSTIDSLTVTDTEILYAIWTINNYVITYNNNFGTPATTTQSYDYNSTNALSFAVPTTAPWTYDGHTFAGWATTSGATTAATSYTVTGTANLYAVWTLNSYAIIYDKNDGTVTPATTSHNFSYGPNNAVLSYATGFTRTGYSLAGWASTGRTGNVLSSYTVSGTATLYAKWTPASNPVIFNPQNGTANITSTYTTDSTIADPGVTPYLAGNHFNGWFIATTGGTAVTFPHLPGTVGTYYLYGQWTPYTVSFDPGTGTGPAPGSMSGVIAHLPGQSLMTAPTNYYFVGWQCPGSATTYLANSSITPTGNITCIAEWALNTSKTVTFHSNYPVGTNVTTVQAGSTAAQLDANPFISGGYTFIGWALTPTGPVAFANRDNYDFLLDADLYAKWTQNQPDLPVFIVNFEYQGGDGSVKVTYYRFGDPGISLPQAQRPGYTFSGWTTEPTNSSTVPAPFTTNQNIKLYAQWVPKTITITFNYQGGTTGVTQMSYKVGDPGVTLPSNTTKSKVYFGGWSDVAGGSAPVAEPFSPTEDITLYAIWNGTTITVRLDPANGEPITKLTYTIGGAPLQLPTRTNPNLNFIGWNAPTNTTSAVPSLFKPTKNVTLYPVWSEPNANTKVIFKGDSAKLTAQAKKILDALVKQVYQSPQHRQLVVDGWVKETLNKSYDMQLSAKRAEQVAAYLRSKGIDAFARLTPRGISPENNDTSRRANISIFYSGPKKK